MGKNRRIEGRRNPGNGRANQSQISFHLPVRFDKTGAAGTAENMFRDFRGADPRGKIHRLTNFKVGMQFLTSHKTQLSVPVAVMFG